MTTNQSSDSVIETEVLQAFYAAINRNDILSALEYFDSQVERIEPEGFPSVGVYRGHAEVKANLSKGRAGRGPKEVAIRSGLLSQAIESSRSCMCG